MKLEVVTTALYRRQLRKAAKRGLDIKLLEKVVDMLAERRELPPKYKNHKLTGNLSGLMECHIQPDWLLIYQIRDNELILILHNTGTHSDLFDE